MANFSLYRGCDQMSLISKGVLKVFNRFDCRVHNFVQWELVALPGRRYRPHNRSGKSNNHEEEAFGHPMEGDMPADISRSRAPSLVRGLSLGIMSGCSFSVTIHFLWKYRTNGQSILVKDEIYKKYARDETGLPAPHSRLLGSFEIWTFVILCGSPVAGCRTVGWRPTLIPAPLTVFRIPPLWFFLDVFPVAITS